MEGKLERVGLPGSTFTVKGLKTADTFSRKVSAPDHKAAVRVLMDWLSDRIARGELAAVGHRVVHGGPKYSAPRRITPALVRDVHQLKPFDPEHLPEEILLTEAFHQRFPKLPQVACFDTAFHHDCRAWPACSPSRASTKRKGFAAMGFTVCRIHT